AVALFARLRLHTSRRPPMRSISQRHQSHVDDADRRTVAWRQLVIHVVGRATWGVTRRRPPVARNAAANSPRPADRTVRGGMAMVPYCASLSCGLPRVVLLSADASRRELGVR